MLLSIQYQPIPSATETIRSYVGGDPNRLRRVDANRLPVQSPFDPANFDAVLAEWKSLWATGMIDGKKVEWAKLQHHGRINPRGLVLNGIDAKAPRFEQRLKGTKGDAEIYGEYWQDELYSKEPGELIFDLPQ